jgi:3'-phosphoadenosine 5'-phosphosulfate (PAPS) 3'-phosphatase
MNLYEKGAEFTWKEDASLLTSEASASHDFLLESVRSLTREVPIISEESEDAAEEFDRSRQIILFGGLTNENCPLSLGNGRAVQNGPPALHGFDVAGSALATTRRDYECFELV